MLDVAEQLRLLREAMNLSPSELSSKTGIPRSTISKIESGGTTKLSRATIKNLALGLSLQETEIKQYFAGAKTIRDLVGLYAFGMSARTDGNSGPAKVARWNASESNEKNDAKRALENALAEEFRTSIHSFDETDTLRSHFNQLAEFYRIFAHEATTKRVVQALLAAIKQFGLSNYDRFESLLFFGMLGLIESREAEINNDSELPARWRAERFAAAHARSVTRVKAAVDDMLGIVIASDPTAFASIMLDEKDAVIHFLTTRFDERSRRWHDLVSRREELVQALPGTRTANVSTDGIETHAVVPDANRSSVLNPTNDHPHDDRATVPVLGTVVAAPTPSGSDAKRPGTDARPRVTMCAGHRALPDHGSRHPAAHASLATDESLVLLMLAVHPGCEQRRVRLLMRLMRPSPTML